MAERDGAAVDVHLRRIDAELAACTATACTENASLSSKRSTSCERPADLLARRLRTASTGVISTSFGAQAARRLADDARQRRQAERAARVSAAITTSAAAPSLTPGALPAVTVPSFLNAGFSAPSDSAVVSARIDSSRSTTIGVALLLRDRDRQDLVLEPALARSRAPPCDGSRRRTRPARRAST